MTRFLKSKADSPNLMKTSICEAVSKKCSFSFLSPGYLKMESSYLPPLESSISSAIHCVTKRSFEVSHEEYQKFFRENFKFELNK